MNIGSNLHKPEDIYRLLGYIRVEEAFSSWEQTNPQAPLPFSVDGHKYFGKIGKIILDLLFENLQQRFDVFFGCLECSTEIKEIKSRISHEK